MIIRMFWLTYLRDNRTLKIVALSLFFFLILTLFYSLSFFILFFCFALCLSACLSVSLSLSLSLTLSLSLFSSLLWVGGVVDTFGAYLRRFWLGEGLKVFWGNFIRRVIVGMSSFRSKVKGCGFKLQQGLLFIECLRAAFRRLPVQNKYGVLVLMFSAFGCWLLYGLVL